MARPTEYIQCWFGRKWKEGKMIRKSTCNNRATGAYTVVTKSFGREVESTWLLCGECGMNRMPNRVRAFIDKETGEMHFYRDVIAIHLIKSITTDFDPAKEPGHEGVKHWVEAQPVPAKLPPVSFTRTRIKTKDCDFKPMDMKAYLRRLANHDDER